MKFYFVNKPVELTDQIIASASNGKVYVENGELHIDCSARQIAYKKGNDGVGWYRLDGANYIFLGKYCAPSVMLENPTINDSSVWQKITYIPKKKTITQ